MILNIEKAIPITIIAIRDNTTPIVTLTPSNIPVPVDLMLFLASFLTALKIRGEKNKPTAINKNTALSAVVK